MKGTARVFHYTIGAWMGSILAEETLQVATAFVLPGERPAVWLTTSEDWEETCNKMVQNKETGEIVPLDREQTASRGKGLFRVEVDPAQVQLHTWNDFKRLAGVSKKTLRLLESIAKEQGSDPTEWRVSFDPIPMSAWICVESWSDDRWEICIGDPIEDEVQQ